MQSLNRVLYQTFSMKALHVLCIILMLNSLSIHHFANASSSENVYIRSSYGQLVTSSTLRWHNTDSRDSKFIATDPTVIRASKRSKNSNISNNGAICRGWHQNQLVPGTTTTPDSRDNAVIKCAVKQFAGSNMHFLDTFQVMIDRTGAARLEWRHWDRFTKLPDGTVAYTDDAFVARKQRHQMSNNIEVENTENQKIYELGDLNLRRSLSGDIAVYNFQDDYGNNIVKKKWEVSYETKGQILVEVEPIRYQLENIQYRAIRAKTEKQVVVLSRRVLTNEIEEGSTDEWDTVTSIAAFNATYRFYWGQIAGLIKALPASATTLSYPQQNKLTEQDETKEVEFIWGLPLEYNRGRIVEVTAKLQPGTSTNITVIGTKTLSKVSYTAKLISIYGDGKTKRRRIDGHYEEKVLKDIKVQQSPPHFTKTGRPAPTTTTTTTTSTTTSTTTTSSTTPLVPTTTLRPKRTTSPLPTSPNPLLRFYPPDEFEDEDPLEEQFMDDMINDAAIFHNEDGTNKRDAGVMSPWASTASKSKAINFQLAIICISISMFKLTKINNLFLNT